MPEPPLQPPDEADDREPYQRDDEDSQDAWNQLELSDAAWHLP